MSALGNYVHFWKVNYNEYGIYPPARRNLTKGKRYTGGDYGDTLFNQAYEHAKDQLIKVSNIQNSVNIAKKLESSYNRLFYTSKTEIVLKFREIMLQALQEMLDEDFQYTMSKVVSENYTVTSTKLQATTNVVQGFANRIKHMHAGDKYHWTRAQQLMEDIEQIYYKVLGDMSKLPSESILQQDLEKLSYELESVMSSLQNDINKTNKERPNIKFDIKKDLSVKLLEQLIIQYSKFNLNLEKGTLFEWMLAVSAENIREIAELAADKGMKDAVDQLKGIMRANVKGGDVNIVNPLRNFREFQFDENIKFKLSDVSNETKTTVKNKIDVEIKDGKGIKRTISAKNVDRATYIQTVGGTTLYRLLSLIHADDFANHYLNIVVKSIKTSGGEDRSYVTNETNLANANNLLKAFAIQSSLIGYLDDTPEFLVINESNAKEPHIFVYSIPALIYAIQQDILNKQNNKIYVDGIDNAMSIEQRFEPEEQGGKNLRIAKLLQKLSNYKINAHLSTAIFDAYTKRREQLDFLGIL